MDTTFWICAALVTYTYVIYPLGIALCANLRASPLRLSPTSSAHDEPPLVSVILCAHNEADRITRRLENLCQQDYDPARLEIVVVSDGSTDGTAARIQAFGERLEATGTPLTVTLIEKKKPEGKAAGLSDAVARCRGDVLLMADARQQFGRTEQDTQTIRRLVEVLSDPDVGCASGELLFVDEHTGTLQANLGTYWRYEKWIRRNESLVDSVPGVTGAIYAMKKHLFEPVPSGTLLDDVLIPLRVAMRGYRVVFDGESFARDHASAHAKQEWRRKVRTLAGNWQLLNLIPAAFVPWRNPIWIQFISHKFLRLLVPFALIGAFATSAAIQTPIFRVIFSIQGAFYCAALLGALMPGQRHYRVLGISYTFALLNLAAIAGFWSWITGRSRKAWAHASETVT